MTGSERVGARIGTPATRGATDPPSFQGITHVCDLALCFTRFIATYGSLIFIGGPNESPHSFINTLYGLCMNVPLRFSDSP